MTDSPNKIALVTGASRGIGQAIATVLGQQGHIVIGTATSESGASAITEHFKAHDIKGAGYALNVCNLDSIQQLFTEITERYGVPLIVVNNAAITRDNLMLRMKTEEWTSVIQTNLDSVFHVSKAAIRGMLKAKWGRIVSITSVVGQTGNPGQVNYCSAKAGVIGFTKSLAQEIAVKGITVNAVAPGFIDTDMTKSLNDQQKQVIEEKIPMGKIGQPEDIANAVAFLASDFSRYITGQVINVNGGLYM